MFEETFDLETELINMTIWLLICVLVHLASPLASLLCYEMIPRQCVLEMISLHLCTTHREGNGTPLQYSCLENPWTEKPGRLQSMGSLRVGHDWATSLWLFTFMHWRRKWQPTPVFLPGDSQGWAAVYGVAQSQTRLKQLSSSSSSVQPSFPFLLTCPSPVTPGHPFGVGFD